MSDLATLAALTDPRLDSDAADPAAAALRLARASLEALAQQLGQTLAARVTGQLPGGFTQLQAGPQTLVLKLETALPPATAVQLRIAASPEGRPSVTVTVAVQSQPQPAAVASMPIQHPTQPTPLHAPPPALPVPFLAAPIQPLPATQAAPSPAPAPSGAPLPPAKPAASAAAGSAAVPPPPTPPAASPVPPPSGPANPAPVVLPALAPAAPAAASLPAAPPQPLPIPLGGTAASPGAPTLSIPSSAANMQVPPSVPAQTRHATPYPAQPPATATAPPRAATATAPLDLSDPARLAVRQDSAAPLLARLATVTAAASGLPRPVLDLAQQLLALRLDLNRAPPDAATLREAVLRAGVASAPARPHVADARGMLLHLRAALLRMPGGEIAPVSPVQRAPPPPQRGDWPRAPMPELPPPPEGGTLEQVRTLLGHTDAALSRLKLLQLASQPPEPGRPAPTELRVEIPLLLGAETGIMQLIVERDGRHQAGRRERGWRLRLALNFSGLGEIGAEIALFGRSANVALWAADADMARAIEDLLPELAPALAARGLDVGSIHLRRPPDRPTPARAGLLLDEAR